MELPSNNLLGVPKKGNAEEYETDVLRSIKLSKCKHKNRAECKHMYAPTSTEECTPEPIPYSFGDNTSVLLWDLPGYGSQIVPEVAQFWEKVTSTHISCK